MLGDETLYLIIAGNKKLSQNAQSEKGSFYDAVECRKKSTGRKYLKGVL